MNRYLKFLAEVLVAALAALVAGLADDVIDAPEWINVVIVALGAVAVLGGGELPAGVWAHTKTIVSAATAGAVLLQSLITDGITASEWSQIALAVVGAVLVSAVPGPVVQRRPGAQVDGVADHAA